MNNVKNDSTTSKNNFKTTTTYTSDPTIKGYLVNINNEINNLREDVFEEQKFAENISNEGKGLFELYKQQLEETKKKIKLNLDKAREEIQIHIKKQEASNARLERHIKQIKLDNAEIEKTFEEKKKRLENLLNIIGPDELLTYNNKQTKRTNYVEKNKK